MAQYSLIGAIYFEFGMLPEGMTQSKVPACLGTFFMGNMVSGSLTKTNAFEIYMNERLLWSSLQTHRKPNMEDLRDSFNKIGIQIGR